MDRADRGIGMRLYIHVGAHKSASTTIQQALVANKEPLEREHGVRFVNIRSGAFYKFFYNRNYMNYPSGPLPSEVLAPLRENLEQMIAGIPQDGALAISAEGFLSHCSLDKYGGIYPHSSRMLAALRDITAQYDTNIILITRRQDTFIESCYLQQIKEGRTITFQDFFFPPHGARKNKLSWRIIADSMAENFGKDKILILPFEEIRKGPEHLLDPISEFIIGEPVPGLVSAAGAANPSISGIGVEVALATFPILKGRVPPHIFNGWRKDLFRRFSSRIYPKAVLFSEEQRRDILTACAADNESMFRAHMPNFDPHYYAA
jgi:hypothetical protein